MSKTRRYPIVFSAQYPSAVENYALLEAAPDRQSRSLLRGLVILGFTSAQEARQQPKPDLNDKEQ